MDYYYPDNMSQETLFGGYWNTKNLVVLVIIFIFSVLLVIAFSFYYCFILFIVYAMFSAKIANGYSITKLAVLYTRFLLTDKLIYFWRSDEK